MKRIILLMHVCLCVLLFLNCSGKNNVNSTIFIEIPDTNFNTFALENFDRNKDEKISLSEALKVKKIKCSGRNINSLEGIERFANLKELDCSNNRIEHLVLTYNRKLNKLNCTGNGNDGTPLMVYIGMSSPLCLTGIQRPADNVEPQLARAQNPLDKKKCTFDANTIPVVSFNE